MISVVLRDGRVLRYNEAENVKKFETGLLAIINDKGAWYSQVNPELIERIDYSRPCRIMKECKDKKKMKTY